MLKSSCAASALGERELITMGALISVYVCVESERIIKSSFVARRLIKLTERTAISWANYFRCDFSLIGIRFPVSNERHIPHAFRSCRTTVRLRERSVDNHFLCAHRRSTYFPHIARPSCRHCSLSHDRQT